SPATCPAPPRPGAVDPPRCPKASRCNPAPAAARRATETKPAPLRARRSTSLPLLPRLETRRPRAEASTAPPRLPTLFDSNKPCVWMRRDEDRLHSLKTTQAKRDGRSFSPAHSRLGRLACHS